MKKYETICLKKTIPKFPAQLESFTGSRALEAFCEAFHLLGGPRGFIEGVFLVPVLGGGWA